MNINTRAVVAYVAARHVTGQNTSCIRDKQQGAYLMITGSFGPQAVSIHDHQDKCQITGTRCDGRYDLLHQGNAARLVIDFDGPEFRGRDESSGEEFSGSAQGRDVHVDEPGGRFGYSL